MREIIGELIDKPNEVIDLLIEGKIYSLALLDGKNKSIVATNIYRNTIVHNLADDPPVWTNSLTCKFLGYNNMGWDIDRRTTLSEELRELYPYHVFTRGYYINVEDYTKDSLIDNIIHLFGIFLQNEIEIKRVWRKNDSRMLAIS